MQFIFMVMLFATSFLARMVADVGAEFVVVFNYLEFCVVLACGCFL